MNIENQTERLYGLEETQTIILVSNALMQDQWRSVMTWLDEQDPEKKVKFNGRAFYFDDPDLAMMFKLTFG